MSGTPAWTRTKDQLIKSQLLYQLSYRGISLVRRGGWIPLPRDDLDRNTSDWSESNRKMSHGRIFFEKASEWRSERRIAWTIGLIGPRHGHTDEMD